MRISDWSSDVCSSDLEAQAIGILGKELHERLAVAAGHLKKLGSGLNSAVNHYNSFVSSFEGRALVSGRKFRDMSLEVGSRESEQVDRVEDLAREAAAEGLPMPAERIGFPRRRKIAIGEAGPQEPVR